MRSTNVGKLTLVLVLLGVVGMIALRPWLARDRGVFPVTGSMGPSEGNVVDRTVAGEAGDSDLDDNQVATPTLDPALVAAVEATMLAARGGTPGPPGEAENYLRIDYDDAPPAAPAAETAYYVRMKTREAKALAMPSATTDWAETPTPPYPVPLSEDDAIAWALSYALEGTSPHDPIARKISHATLKSRFGFDGMLSGSELVWVVAVKANGMNDLSWAPRLGMAPPEGTTPRPVDGYLLVFSVAGQAIGGGMLYPEDLATSKQRYSDFVNLRSEQ